MSQSAATTIRYFCLAFVFIRVRLRAMNSITSLSPAQLRKAADIQEKIQSLQKELSALLGGEVPAQATEAPKRKKVSAAGRARMRAAQVARWAAIKGTAPAKPAPEAKRKMSAAGLANIRAGVAKRMAAQGKAPATKPAKKAKKTFSPAAKAALSAAAKARWAKVKAAGKSRL
jgi:hypothetical protein